jgi:glycosyltransferase involved in cell wall biosynthesis
MFGVPKRLNVLVSIYACEPGAGSELGIGWNWALQLARFHHVTVLTRANNRERIESELQRLADQRPLLRFIYHDLSPEILALKKRWKFVRPYYVLWQKSAQQVVAKACREQEFDVIHHVTLGTFRYRTAIWGHGVPTVWGPIGGAESIPLGLLPWRHPRSLLPEVARNLNNLFNLATLGAVRTRALNSTRVLASTRRMQEALADLGVGSELISPIGLDTTTVAARTVLPPRGPLKFVFVGNLLMLKGIDLAIEALHASGTNARFSIVGEGPFRAALEQLTDRLGMRERVEFLGRIPRQKVLEMYSQFDAMLFPSLHDTGGYAVIEAMLYQLPVICLQAGGPEAAVQPGSGVRVPIGPRKSVVRGIAEAIRTYDSDRAKLVEHGTAAREVVIRDYDWQRKGERIAAIYEKLFPPRAPQPRRPSSWTSDQKPDASLANGAKYRLEFCGIREPEADPATSAVSRYVAWPGE